MILSIHTPFAERVVAKHDALLLNEGPEEQTARVVAALERIGAVTTFGPTRAGRVVDLAGFGEAPIVYITKDDDYLLLSDVAEALGWPLHKAHAWAQQQHSWAIEDQRNHDEERGDGRLGWECLLGYIDLRLDLSEDDPEAKPDANGQKWSHSGDWLVSQDRLPALLCSSPWGKEFLDNVGDHMGLMFQKVFGDKLKNSPTVHADGTPTGHSAWDMFSSDLTEEEALRKARRGPALDEADGTG
ncbi:hypothetical protein EDD90_7360 [Streptomyces sp. Ag109_O5-1]|uniref:hypothetical protein n=1 Tax=Streptomyces sp. Ag109_O5-1 TaxID=1938851 RepID=UPI000F5032B6|nr:hypothetical protein [Streptomyces sp. Ag109_O5-1]RPE44130.1 hypothetical protein EDD90_7360 [Streptomyces sp. Ag109_O5-1]